MTTVPATATVTEQAVRDLVADWYRALDRHDDITLVLPYLVDEGLVMRFPEATEHGHAGFRNWYAAVTHRFFDEVHTLGEVTLGASRDDGAVPVGVVVNWQARIWTPPSPRSQWLGFEAYQTWAVVTGPEGRAQILEYAVDRLDPMPGSTPL